MTLYSPQEQGPQLPLLFSPHLEGQPQPWSAIHLGIQYPGELIMASRWDDTWSRELTESYYFRIVLLTSRHRLVGLSLRDARIAVCLPAQDLLQRREGLDRELRSIAEARELYTTRRQPDSQALRSSLERREAELHGEFLEGCSRAYEDGQIRTVLNVPLEPGSIFASTEPARWVQHLAEAILAGVYPNLPIERGAFSRPLVEEDLPGLFEGFLAETSQAPVEEGTASFAVGLGLARRETPYAFDPQDCTLFELVRRELERRGPGIPIADLVQLLGHSCGLPLPLVALFLLAFVKYGRPEAELDLAEENPLITRQGTPFQGDRLTRETVGQIRWYGGLCTLLTRLHLPEPPTWNTALPLIQLIEPRAQRAALADVPSQEAMLVSRLKELSEAAREALRDLRVLLEDEDTAEVEGRLQALVSLGQSGGYRQFYDRVREDFQGRRSLAHERRLPARVRQLREMLPEIRAVRSYLRDMSFGPSGDSMSLNHQALLYETSTTHILESPTLWPAIRERFGQLRSSYMERYGLHHAQYNREASALWGRLQHALPLVEALEQLNAIAELGPPVGEELPHRFDTLYVALKMCPAAEGEVPLEESPLCPYCGLLLPEGVPHQETESFLLDVEQALQEQNRRLSLRGIQQILAQGGEEMVDKLIRIVQVSDLAPLANVLNAQVVAFLRSFLASR